MTTRVLPTIQFFVESDDYKENPTKPFGQLSRFNFRPEFLGLRVPTGESHVYIITVKRGLLADSHAVSRFVPPQSVHQCPRQATKSRTLKDACMGSIGQLSSYGPNKKEAALMQEIENMKEQTVLHSQSQV
jgi:hypothetical protein